MKRLTTDEIRLLAWREDEQEWDCEDYDAWEEKRDRKTKLVLEIMGRTGRFDCSMGNKSCTE